MIYIYWLLLWYLQTCSIWYKPIYHLSKKLEVQHWAEPVSLTFHSALRKLNIPSIGASHQISAHFGQTVSEKILRNRPIYNKNCLWQPCLLMDQDEMSNCYRGPSIDASYQVSYHLVKRFKRKSCFRNRPTRNKKCPDGHIC
jgi:hypothetical protein